MTKRARCKFILTGLLLLSLPGLAFGEEYFGKFESAPQIEPVSTGDPDRQRFKLLDDFVYVDPNRNQWKVPGGYDKLDGASIPKFFWSLIGAPLTGNYLHASIVHDYYCEKKSRTQHDTHRVFYYAMRANGVPEPKAKIMYLAVAAFGPKWKLTTDAIMCLEGLARCASIPPAVEVIPATDFDAIVYGEVKEIKEMFDDIEDGILYLDLDEIDALATLMARRE